jgi:hypothetical protein
MTRTIVLHVDKDQRNADWTKRYWDLPPVDSPAFARFLADHHLTKEQFMQSMAANLPQSVVLKSDNKG